MSKSAEGYGALLNQCRTLLVCVFPPTPLTYAQVSMEMVCVSLPAHSRRIIRTVHVAFSTSTFIGMQGLGHIDNAQRITHIYKSLYCPLFESLGPACQGACLYADCHWRVDADGQGKFGSRYICQRSQQSRIFVRK